MKISLIITYKMSIVPTKKEYTGQIASNFFFTGQMGTNGFFKQDLKLFLNEG